MLWHLETSGRIMGILSARFDNVELQCNANMYVVGLHFARKDSRKDRPVRSQERSYKYNTIDFGLAYPHCVITNALPTLYIYHKP